MEIHKNYMIMHDLVTADICYHNNCKPEFYSGFPTNTERPGQPKKLIRNKNFNAVCKKAEADTYT